MTNAPLLYRESCTWPCITQTPRPVIAHNAILGFSHAAKIDVLHAGMSLP